MQQAQLERLRQDIDTIQEAGGIELPFGREDLFIHAGLGAWGLVLAAWPWVLPPDRARLWVVPAVVLLVAYVHLRRKYRRALGRSPVRRREYTTALVAPIFVLPATVSYFAWAIWQGLALWTVAGAGMFFLGLMFAVWAMVDVRRRSNLGSAIPLMAMGLAAPVVDNAWLTCALGLGVATAGLLTGLIMHHQLRQQDQRTDRQS